MSLFSIKIGELCDQGNSNNKKGTFMKKKYIIGLAASLIGISSLSQAAEMTISGQVNRAVMSADDGEKTETYFVDNTNSSTRFRFALTDQITDNILAGVMLEMEFQSNSSSAVSRANPQIASELKERKAEVFFKGPFGEVYLGQGDGSANGYTHLDLSGTNVVALMGHAHLFGGGTRFLEGNLTGPTVTGAIANFDFESRYDRIEYSTNQFGPLTLSATIGRKADMIYEGAAQYRSDFSGGKFLAGIGYSTEEVAGPADSNDTIGGSASILLDNGLNAGLSYSQLEADADYKSDNTTFRVGYKAGRHASSVDYGMTNDRAQKGDEATYIGLNYVFKPVGWAELYATGRVFSLDRENTNFDDITVVAMGSRIKF